MEVASSAVGVVAFAIHLVDNAIQLKRFLSAVQGAPKLIAELVEDLENADRMLESLRDVPEFHDAVIESMLKRMCDRTSQLVEIVEVLEKRADRKGKGGHLWRNVKAAFREPELIDLRKELHEIFEKATLYRSGKIGQEVLNTSRAVVERVEDVKNSISDGNRRITESVEEGFSRVITAASEGNSRLFSNIAQEVCRMQECSTSAILSGVESILEEKLMAITNQIDGMADEICRRNKIPGMSSISVRDSVRSIKEDASFRQAIHPSSNFFMARKRKPEIRGTYKILIGRIDWSVKALEKVVVYQNGETAYTDTETEVHFEFVPSRWVLAHGLNATFKRAYGGWNTPVLYFPRYVPHDALIFKLCADGNLSAIMDLFDRGMASPYDRRDVYAESLLTRGSPDDFGATLLEVAAMNLKVDVCNFLIQTGAKVSSIGSAFTLISNKLFDTSMDFPENPEKLPLVEKIFDILMATPDYREWRIAHPATEFYEVPQAIIMSNMQYPSYIERLPHHWNIEAAEICIMTDALLLSYTDQCYKSPMEYDKETFRLLENLLLRFQNFIGHAHSKRAHLELKSSLPFENPACECEGICNPLACYILFHFLRENSEYGPSEDASSQGIGEMLVTHNVERATRTDFRIHRLVRLLEMGASTTGSRNLSPSYLAIEEPYFFYSWCCALLIKYKGEDSDFSLEKFLSEDASLKRAGWTLPAVKIMLSYQLDRPISSFEWAYLRSLAILGLRAECIPQQYHHSGDSIINSQVLLKRLWENCYLNVEAVPLENGSLRFNAFAVLGCDCSDCKEVRREEHLTDLKLKKVGCNDNSHSCEGKKEKRYNFYLEQWLSVWGKRGGIRFFSREHHRCMPEISISVCFPFTMAISQAIGEPNYTGTPSVSIADLCYECATYVKMKYFVVGRLKRLFGKNECEVDQRGETLEASMPGAWVSDSDNDEGRREIYWTDLDEFRDYLFKCGKLRLNSMRWRSGYHYFVPGPSTPPEILYAIAPNLRENAAPIRAIFLESVEGKQHGSWTVRRKIQYGSPGRL